LIGTSLALTDYQRGILDGLNHGWQMAQKYDQAKAGDIIAFNQAVPEYNTWIISIFGQNESLMLQPLMSRSSIANSRSVSMKPDVSQSQTTNDFFLMLQACKTNGS
jgi:hypothetical protein